MLHPYVYKLPIVIIIIITIMIIIIIIIQCKSDKGAETSDVIRFRSGLPLGDALCPKLFTLYMNPVASDVNSH